MKKKEIEKIFDKYVSHPSDDKYVYTEVDNDKLESDLFRNSIDKKSEEYIILALIWYGVTNINAVYEVVKWGNK